MSRSVIRLSPGARHSWAPEKIRDLILTELVKHASGRTLVQLVTASTARWNSDTWMAFERVLFGMKRDGRVNMVNTADGYAYSLSVNHWLRLVRAAQGEKAHGSAEGRM